MPRINRIEVANIPYHIIHRGNRRQKVFLNELDKEFYLQILTLQAKFYQIEIWAYCLMDNHVHLIVCPRLKDTLTICISETHRQYTRMINFREKWRGHLWQGRFKSYPLDEKYLFSAIRYVERNPVRAKLVTKAEDYKFSSAKSHIKKERNVILSNFYLISQITDWGKYLEDVDDKGHLVELRRNQETGRPLGETNFVEKLELMTGLELIKRKPGPKIKVLI